MASKIHCVVCDQIVDYPHKTCPGLPVADAARSGFNTLYTDSGATPPARPTPPQPRDDE